MSKPLHLRYKYRTLWSDEDEEYVGLCDEFPSLSWLEENKNDALFGIQKLVYESVEDMETDNEPCPIPGANIRAHTDSPALMSSVDSARQILSDAAYKKLLLEMEKDRKLR